MLEGVNEVDGEPRLERYLRLHRDLGLPPITQIQQLMAAGFSATVLRPHFPDQPASAFEPRPDISGVARSIPSRRASPSDPPRAVAGLDQALQRLSRRAMEAAANGPCADPKAITPDPVIRPPTPGPSGAPRPDPLVGGISFQYVPLIQCSFPHTDPGATAHFSRRNGWLELTLSAARPDTGLPYGVPARLLTMFCASEAIRKRTPEIYLGATLHDFLRLLDVPITRGERGSLRVYANQLLRLVHCAISVDENIRDNSGRTGLHIRQALFVEEARLWWDQQDGVGQGSSLVLSSVLYDSILERSAPLSTAAIRQLRKSPMDLDVYAWLVHRLFQLHRPSTISWPQLSGQFGHDYAELRYFRRFFGDSLKRVLKAYPEARVRVEDGGLTLLPSKTHVESRTSRPG